MLEVIGANRNLKKIQKLTKDEKYHLKHLKEQIKHLLGIINKFLKASEKKKAKIEPVLRKALEVLVPKQKQELKGFLDDIEKEGLIIHQIIKHALVEKEVLKTLKKYSLKAEDVDKKLLKMDTEIFEQIETSIKNTSAHIFELLEQIEEGKFLGEEGARDLKVIVESIQTQFETIGVAFKELAIRISETSKWVITRRKFMKVAVGTTGLFALSTATLKGAGAILTYYASRLPRRDKDALAILISQPKTFLEGIFSNFISIYTARMQLAFGYRAKVIKLNAKSTDFKKILFDKTIQNVVVFGHGTRLTWFASDKIVSDDDLHDWRTRKKGHFLKHTCGEKASGAVYRYVPEEVKTEFENRIIEINKTLKKKGSAFRADPYVPYYIYGEDSRIYKRIKEFRKDLKELEFKRKENPQYFEIMIVENGETVPLESDDPFDDSDVREIDAVVAWIEGKIEKVDIFGLPIFKRGKICDWKRIADPIEWIYDPFAETSLSRKNDKFRMTIRKLFMKINK